MSASLPGRIRERVVGGSPSPWDAATAWGVSIGAFLLALVLARDRQIDVIPVAGLREELLLVVAAAGSALVVIFPLLLLMLALAGAVRPPTERMRGWLIAVAALVILSGFAAPLALREAWSVEPAWTPAGEPLAWLVSDLPAAALSGIAPGAGAGEMLVARPADIAGRCAGWLAALSAWLACWPLIRGVPRGQVHVGWPAIVSFGALAVAAMLVRTFVTSREPTLAAVTIACVLASVVPCVVAWRFVARAGARWPLVEETAVGSAGRSADPLMLARVAGVAFLAIVGWLAFLAILSPPALRTVATALRDRPRVGAVAPDFTVLDRDGRAVRLRDLRGRPVLVSFGASWCGPCKQEFPHLAELAATGGDVGLAVLWISKDAERAALEAFLSTEPRLPTVALANEDVLLSYDVEGIPSTFLIDASGRVAWRQLGWGRGGEARLSDALAALGPRRAT